MSILTPISLKIIDHSNCENTIMVTIIDKYSTRISVKVIYLKTIFIITFYYLSFIKINKFIIIQYIRIIFIKLSYNRALNLRWSLLKKS